MLWSSRASLPPIDSSSPVAPPAVSECRSALRRRRLCGHLRQLPWLHAIRLQLLRARQLQLPRMRLRTGGLVEAGFGLIECLLQERGGASVGHEEGHGEPPTVGRPDEAVRLRRNREDAAGVWVVCGCEAYSLTATLAGRDEGQLPAVGRPHGRAGGRRGKLEGLSVGHAEQPEAFGVAVFLRVCCGDDEGDPMSVGADANVVYGLEAQQIGVAEGLLSLRGGGRRRGGRACARGAGQASARATAASRSKGRRDTAVCVRPDGIAKSSSRRLI